MAAKELPSLGELEIEVLRRVWRAQPCTERQIWESLRDDRAVGRTTVLKTLQRLEAKGLLARAAAKGPVRFRAVVAPQRLLGAIVRRFVERSLAGSLEPLVNYMAGSAKLSSKDLAALKAIARRMATEERAHKG